ncbi:MAG: hypothetical protein HQ558_04625 [Candidatus Omnitrophica bacterium]|nr:hypothetical protein [Candidatus Omnitrophota bacterium]
MLKIMLIVNWGLGLEILKTLNNLPDVQVDFVITCHDSQKKDCWCNVVYGYCLAQRIKVEEQESINFQALQQDIKASGIDLLIIHSYMFRLPEEVFSAPKYGTINIHPSLLPKHRGPSPNYWVIKNKEAVTGLTAHYMNKEIDAGPIINQVEIPVVPADSTETLINKQKQCVGMLLQETLRRAADKKFIPTSQDEKQATYAPRPRHKGGPA